MYAVVGLIHVLKLGGQTYFIVNAFLVNVNFVASTSHAFPTCIYLAPYAPVTNKKVPIVKDLKTRIKNSVSPS